MNKYCTLKEQKKYNHLIESDKLYDIIKNKEECLLFDTSYYNIHNINNEDIFDDYDNVESIEGSIPMNSIISHNENSNFSFFFPTKNEFFIYLKNILIKNKRNITMLLENIPIILYEKEDIFYSPRIWFIFKMYGFKNVQILNGGLNKWIHEEKEIIHVNNEKKIIEEHTNKQTIEQNEYYISHINNLLEKHFKKNENYINKNIMNSIYYYEDIQNLIKLKEQKQMQNYLLVDTRPNKSFSTLISINENIKVNNFIPFSINIPYNHFLNYHYENYKYVTFKNMKDIKILLEKYDLLNDQKIIISTCNKGISACLILFLLNLFDKPFSKLILYPGSLVEYNFYKYERN